jgi:alpha-beta hydrolase superfamily lysophospholipase
MTGPAADVRPGTLGGRDAVSRLVQASDGVELHCLRWCSGRSPPWAVVVFLHGIASHGGWFAETATDLDKQGVAVYAPDRRGSGRSGGRRGHLDRYEQALDDVDEVVRLVAAEHPGTPVFLAGSSWAAKLAVVYAAREPAPLSGLLLLGPGLLPRVKLSPLRQVLVVVGHLAAPTAHLPIPLSPELYTTNPRYLRPASSGLELPLLVLQGEDDAMMDVAGTRRWFSRLGVGDKTYVAYPGAGHTLDFEPDRSRYLADVVGWLSAQVPSGSPRPTGGGP